MFKPLGMHTKESFTFQTGKAGFAQSHQASESWSFIWKRKYMSNKTDIFRQKRKYVRSSIEHLASLLTRWDGNWFSLWYILGCKYSVVAGLAAATYASNIQERNSSKQGLRHMFSMREKSRGKILDQFTESFLLLLCSLSWCWQQAAWDWAVEPPHWLKLRHLLNRMRHLPRRYYSSGQNLVKCPLHLQRRMRNVLFL